MNDSARELRAQSAVAEWNRVHGHRVRVRMAHVIPCLSVHSPDGSECCFDGPRYWTIGPARIVRDHAGRANAMVTIEGTLGDQPLERVVVIGDRLAPSSPAQTEDAEEGMREGEDDGK